ncbi:MAG: hypothetical protein AAF657_04645 [Acidobacteriota bacterium]
MQLTAKTLRPLNRRAIVPLFLLLVLISAERPAGAASAGAVSIRFTEVEKFSRIQRFHTQTLRVITPADLPAPVSSNQWPADGTFILPTTVRIVDIVFADGLPPADADAILADCSQKAIVAQARPERYDFELWVWVHDVDADLLEAGVDWLAITLREASYGLSCTLTRID